jgi:hypothetical protein
MMISGTDQIIGSNRRSVGIGRQQNMSPHRGWMSDLCYGMHGSDHGGIVEPLAMSQGNP